MIGDTDSDGDGVCDSYDECPDNPLKYEAGMCGCDGNDSDSDWVCDDEDICPGGNDKKDVIPVQIVLLVIATEMEYAMMRISAPEEMILST